jgi:hypothetical protein
MSSGLYTILKTNLMNKLVNLGSSGDTFYVGLLSATPTFTATQTTWAQLIGVTPEITGTGYTTNGVALTGQSVSTVGTTAVWSASTAQWTSASFTAYGAAIYDSTVSNNLLVLMDFGGALTVSSGTFAIIWSGSGIIILS